MGDRHADLRGLDDEPVFITGDDIDGDCLADAGAAEQTGQGRVIGRALSKEHGGFRISPFDRQPAGAPLGDAVGQVKGAVAALAQQFDRVAGHQTKRARQ